MPTNRIEHCSDHAGAPSAGLMHNIIISIRTPDLAPGRTLTKRGNVCHD